MSKHRAKPRRRVAFGVLVVAAFALAVAGGGIALRLSTASFADPALNASPAAYRVGADGQSHRPRDSHAKRTRVRASAVPSAAVPSVAEGAVGRTTGSSAATTAAKSAPASSRAAVVASTAASSPSGSPLGVPGSWRLAFDDEFNGTSLDGSRWTPLDGWQMNNVTTRASNVTESAGNLILTLSSRTDGAEVDSSPADGAGANGFLLQVGDYAEARIAFPGDGQRLYNWPAWWASGPGWPAAGEHDIAEVLSGELTVNYHSSSGSHNQGAVSGSWGNGFHVYGVHRFADHADVYWDGQLVKSYPTDDDGQGEALLINVGQSSNPVTGAASQLKVDWVRAYHPAG